MPYKINKNVSIKSIKKNTHYALQDQQNCTPKNSKIIEQLQRNVLTYTTTHEENEAVLFCQHHQQSFTHSF